MAIGELTCWPATFSFGEKVNVALLVVTTLYLLVTTAIWLTARNSLKLAFLDLRPWVTTGAFGTQGQAVPITAQTITTFMTTMKNVGKTPAFVKTAATSTNVYQQLPANVPSLPGTSCPVLAPGDERDLQIVIPAIQANHLAQIGSTLHLVTFVIIEYEDSQHRRHKTISAHELVQLPGTTGFRWQDLPQHGVMS